MNQQPSDLILHNGKIATQDDRRSLVEAVAIRDGKFIAAGSDREIMRLRGESSKLIAIQHRMAFQGEYFRDRYGSVATKRTPPILEMLRTGLPVGAGTDATRVATYNPFVSLSWLVTGKTVGGLAMYDDENRLDRMEALRLWTVGSSWFSTEEGAKGSIVAGQLADLAVLSADYFSVADDEIKNLESVLTIVGGKPVYAAEEFAELAPPLPPVLPDWSPVAAYGGYHKPATAPAVIHSHAVEHGCHEREIGGGMGCLCWAF